MLMFQVLYTYLPLMNNLLHSAPIGLGAWARIAIAGLAAYLVVELEKKLRHNRTNNQYKTTLVDSKGAEYG